MTMIAGIAATATHNSKMGLEATKGCQDHDDDDQQTIEIGVLRRSSRSVSEEVGPGGNTIIITNNGTKRRISVALTRPI